MVVMNPDAVSRLPVLGDGVGEGFIHSQVLFPGVIVVLGVSRALLHLIVQCGPKHRSAEMGIVAFELVVAYKDGQRLMVMPESLIDEASREV